MSSCSLSLAVKDYVKRESCNLSFGDDKKDEASSSYDQNQEPKLPEEMTQTLDLFRRYLSNEKAIKKYLSIDTVTTDETEPEATRPEAIARALIPPKFNGGHRPLSILERSILPSLGDNAIVPGTRRDEHKNSPAQLTIFYAGMINVYDDVPLDKAQAIMLLAGQNTLSAPLVSNITKTEAKKPMHNHLNLSSTCKIQAGLPVARKYSLQRFLEKRRGRITNKSPYASPDIRGHDEDDGARVELHVDEKQKFTLLPFPSRYKDVFARKA